MVSGGIEGGGPFSGPSLATLARRGHNTGVIPIIPTPELLERLVAFDTTSRHSNMALADFVCDYLDRPHVRVIRHPSTDGTKTNLVVIVGPEVDPEDRGGLVLSGHMDVVPAGESEWHSDPFTLTRRDDRLIGRGSCDMKGFLALAVDAVARADAATLRRPLSLLLTFDEEIGTLGARHFVRTPPPDLVLPRRVIIGEPTGFTAVRLHKGHMRLVLTTEGKAAHSGFPQSGSNAIEPMARAIVALSGLRGQLESERTESSSHFGEVPFVTLNVARIDGGSATNVVPDRCRLDIGIRLLPGMDGDAMVDRVRETIHGALGRSEFDLETMYQSPPMVLPADNDLYRALCDSVGQRDTASVYYATDGGWLSQAGFECVVFGPGDMDTAHKPDEWLPLADLEWGAKLVAQIVARYCGPPR